MQRQELKNYVFVTVLLHHPATKEVRREWSEDTGGKEKREAEMKGPQHSFNSEQQCKAQAADF